MRLKSAHLLFVAAIGIVGIARAGDDRTDRREASSTAGMKVHVVRLRPGEDLLKSIGTYVREKKIAAGIVLTTVGSLTVTTLRFANRSEATIRTGKVEIVSLVGTVEPGGGHLHLSVRRRGGNVRRASDRRVQNLHDRRDRDWRASAASFSARAGLR